MVTLDQIPTTPPGDVITLLWIVTGTALAAVGGLFRLLQLEQRKYQEMLTKALEIIAVNAAAMTAMKEVPNEIATLTDIRDRLGRIEARDGKQTAGG